VWITSSKDTVLTPTAVALGNFDGFHRGHQQVVRPILNPNEVAVDSQKVGFIKTDEKTPPVAISGYGTVVTFNPHPQEFFTGQTKKLLTPLPEKIDILRRFGVQQLVLLPFDKDLASLTPAQFVEQILVEYLQATRVSVGFDFRFGRHRMGSTEDLKAIASQYGIDVEIVSRFKSAYGDRISSSIIRESLTEGHLNRANQLLGRAYTLVGQVVQGQQLGRTLGFPTANLQLPPDKFLPQYGVYAVLVTGFAFGEQTTIAPQLGVMNIGCRPTVAGDNPTVEVHLLDWHGDLYGQSLTVSLEGFLRPEQKFASLEQLKAQIQRDCTHARTYLQARKNLPLLD
jgi:riboflavin kinase/FMN adenylyltransferase